VADKQALYEFSRWVAGCSGNEKQEARTFIEKLLRAWGRSAKDDLLSNLLDLNQD
jgi:hypothetical protein